MGDRLDGECVREASNEATTALVFPAVLLQNRVELKEKSGVLASQIKQHGTMMMSVIIMVMKVF